MRGGTPGSVRAGTRRTVCARPPSLPLRPERKAPCSDGAPLRSGAGRGIPKRRRSSAGSCTGARSGARHCAARRRGCPSWSRGRVNEKWRHRGRRDFVGAWGLRPQMIASKSSHPHASPRRRIESLMRRSDPMGAINRREFMMQAGALAAAGSALGAATQPEGWFDRPMRWAQLTLVEDDPGKYDPQFWLDYFPRTHSDAACLSAGGCVAYYPTKIPLHYRSQWLGDRDPLRRPGGRLPQAEHGGDRAHRSARRAPGRLRRAPRLDRRRRRRPASAATGPCRNCGSPARWALTTSSS